MHLAIAPLKMWLRLAAQLLANSFNPKFAIVNYLLWFYYSAQGLTSNPDLQLLLTYSWGDYGTPPSRGSFSLQALLTSHYEHGNYALEIYSVS